MNKTIAIIIVVAVIIVALPLVLSQLKDGQKGTAEGQAGDSMDDAAAASSESVGDPYAMTTAHFAGEQVKCPAFAAAILEGDRERVQAFLDSGTNVNRTMRIQRPGKTASNLGAVYLAVSAVANGKATTDFIEFLIKEGADVNGATGSGTTPLHLAAITGRADIAQTLISLGANVNAREKHGRTPLGSVSGAPAVADVLRQHGAVQ